MVFVIIVVINKLDIDYIYWYIKVTNLRDIEMNITDITSDKAADAYLFWCIGNIREGLDFAKSLELDIEDWVEEFDKLEQGMKWVDENRMNHYKMNRLTGLYFLIPVAINFINELEDVPETSETFDGMNIRDQYSPEQQRLWDENSILPKEWEDDDYDIDDIDEDDK